MQRHLIKSLLFTLLGTTMLMMADAQVNKSYVRAWDLSAPQTSPAAIPSLSIGEAKQATQYFDGLGRSSQTVAKKISPLQKDMVSFDVYDEYSGEKINYLPFVSTQTSGGSESTNDGLYKPNALQQQAAFYNDLNPYNPIRYQGESNWLYSQTNFESSPLNRVTTAYAPGSSWIGGNRGVTMTYELNVANEVRLWTISGTGLVLPTSTDWYGANEIYRGVTADENGKRVVLYKDKAGSLLLKKVEIKHNGSAGITSHADWLCTYYIYDDLKNLRFVIQPKGVGLLEIASWTFGTTDFNSSNIAKELCYYYEYDQRNRLIRKKVPGAGEIYMVYDTRDRLVMTQDANLRQSPARWSVTLYDVNNRPVQTGLLLNSYWSGSKTFDQHRADATTSLAYPFAVSSPPSSTYWEMLTETHYDNYENLPPGLNSSLITTYINSTNFITTYNVSPDYALPIMKSDAVTGLPTWSKTKVLGTTNTFISIVTIYDEKGRVIQLQQINNTGGVDIVTTQYDFSGKVLRSHQKVQKSTGGNHEFQLRTKMVYDHAGRLTRLKKALTVGTTPYSEKTISRLEYDELGQLKHKKVGTLPNTSDDPLETLDFDYNIRGWLLGVNRSFLETPDKTHRWFGFDLGYDKAPHAYYGYYNSAQYTGNIAGVIWKSKGDKIARKYDYVYDPSNRLIKADFTQQNDGGTSWLQSQINFSLQMGDGTTPGNAYDENGNIKKMTQYGWKVSGSTMIDNLEYRYINNGNRLQVVLDQNNDPVTKLGDFRTSALHPQVGTKNLSNINSIIDYTYDNNGNLLRDYNKDFGNSGNDGIVYNHLNLIQALTVRTTGGAVKGTITYAYDAAGIKLTKVTTENNASVLYNGNNYTTNITTTTTYLGGAVYESKSYSNGSLSPLNYNDGLQFISHEEGRIRYSQANTNNPYPYDYFIKDHLGNNRIVLTEEDKPDPYPQLTFEDVELTEQNASWENANGQSINIAGAGVRTLGVSGFNSNTDNGAYVRLIKKSTGAIGAGKLLKVMAGDRIHTYVEYYYTDANANNGGANPLGSFVSSLASVFGVNGQVGGLLKNESATITTQLQGNSTFTTFVNPAPNTSGGNSAPKAYLNVLFFDEQFKFDGTSSVIIPVNYSPNTKQNIDKRFSNAIAAGKSGYVYVYFSNESESNVYFDNFMLTHERSSLIEETHYYPFGARLEGICSKAYNKLENKFQYGSKERQAKEFTDGSGLEMYDFGARMYDNQIGRWMSVDPLTERMRRHSPYNYAFNNPIRYIDPDGMLPGEYNDVRDKARNFGKDRAEDEAAEEETTGNEEADGESPHLKYISSKFMGSYTISDIDVDYYDEEDRPAATVFEAQTTTSYVLVTYQDERTGKNYSVMEKDVTKTETSVMMRLVVIKDPKTEAHHVPGDIPLYGSTNGPMFYLKLTIAIQTTEKSTFRMERVSKRKFEYREICSTRNIKILEEKDLKGGLAKAVHQTKSEYFERQKSSLLRKYLEYVWDEATKKEKRSMPPQGKGY